MKFYPLETQSIYLGKPVLSNNNLCFVTNHSSDTVVQFGGWWQELNIDSATHSLVSFEAIFAQDKIKKASLVIPAFLNAKITVDSISDVHKSLKIYYDENNGWFCFGNKQYQGTGYQFATNTIAIINKNDLEAIFIKPCKE